MSETNQSSPRFRQIIGTLGLGKVIAIGLGIGIGLGLLGGLLGLPTGVVGGLTGGVIVVTLNALARRKS